MSLEKVAVLKPKAPKRLPKKPAKKAPRRRPIAR